MSKPKQQPPAGPPYLFKSPVGISIMPYEQIIATLELNAREQSKNDLKLGPLFRKVTGDFREWNHAAEPGWLFEAPELGVCAVRLSAMIPPAISISEERQKQLQAAAEAQAKEAEGPKIAVA